MSPLMIIEIHVFVFNSIQYSKETKWIVFRNGAAQKKKYPFDPYFRLWWYFVFAYFKSSFRNHWIVYGFIFKVHINCDQMTWLLRSAFSEKTHTGVLCTRRFTKAWQTIYVHEDDFNLMFHLWELNITTSAHHYTSIQILCHYQIWSYL